VLAQEVVQVGKDRLLAGKQYGGIWPAVQLIQPLLTGIALAHEDCPKSTSSQIISTQ
jgi:hypothetical protein